MPANRKVSQRHKARLQVGVYNLRVASALITANRRMCRAKTGKPALFARWLASYQGANRPGRGVWCNMKRDARGRVGALIFVKEILAG